MSRLHDPNRRQVLQRKEHLVASGIQHSYCKCVLFCFFFWMETFLCVRLTFVHGLRVICLQRHFALDNLPMSVPCPFGVYVIPPCLLQYTYTYTNAHNGTRNTLKDKHRVAFTAQTGTRGHVYPQVCKWSRQSMRSDWLRLRTHTGGSGDRDRRVMMTSSRSAGELIWELCWAEPWQTRGGAWGGQGSWPYLRGHAANGV